MKFVIPFIFTLISLFFNIYVEWFNTTILTLQIDVMFFTITLIAFLLEINVRKLNEK